MNLHHLKTFYLTAKYLSVTRAAAEMNIAQPAATRHLKELQSDIDIVLFNNRGKKIYLTNEGRILYEKTEKIFLQEVELESAIDDIKRLKNGLLSISTQATFGDYFLPGVLLDFYKLFPEISLTVSTYLDDEEIISSIEKMGYDIGISSVQPKIKTLNSTKIFTAHQSLIIPPGHRLSGEKIITPEMLDGEVFILPEKSTRSRKLIDSYFKTYDIKAKVLYELGHTIPIVEIIKNNIGISITYTKTVAADINGGKILSKSLKDPDNILSRNFFLVYNKERNISNITVEFIKTVQKWASKSSP
ncbi:MAG: LysR family transcriptional regulator [Spirochaetia bacterium]|jgi:DNA-binding transcriptional LysR family regulator|nr:LysR family transcriptional regulator [Spirochaetia bacterium]